MSVISEQEQRRDEEPEKESVLRDLELPEGEAEDVQGGSVKCPSWLCGPGGNHNEVQAFTA